MLKGKILLKEIKVNKTLFLMLIPAFIYFIIFFYLPMVGVYLAFTRFDFQGGIFGSPFIGFENFKFLLPNLLNITKNTILYNIAFIIVNNFLQILVAIILSEVIGNVYKKICQSIMLLPYFVSFVLIGAFTYNIFNYEFGVLNSILNSLGLESVNLYSDVGIWKYILVGLNAWKFTGYGTIIYLATIMGIGCEFYEAAKIDGASKWKAIWHITLPFLKPTFIILLMFSLSSILKGQFELFYQIIGDNGTLFPSTDIIDTYVYRSLVKTFDIGMAAAAGFYQSAFGFVLIIGINYLVRKINSEYALF